MTARAVPEWPDVIASAVRSVPGVVDLHPGTFGEVASYLPGRRVVGVRGDGTTVEVHVVVDSGEPVRVTAEAIRRSLTALGACVVDVVVEDVVPVGRRGRTAGSTSPAPLREETA